MPPSAAAPDTIAHPAATLLLLRDGAAGLEVLMVTRHAETAFAGGALVFPGGRVDPADGAAAMLRHCAAVAGVDDAAMAFRVAGIRESFEEAHILMARPTGVADLLSASALADLERSGAVDQAAPSRFGALLAGGSITLASDLLVPFAHWITPRGRAKRFDTHFFLAPTPRDQVAVHDGREVVASTWIAPATAVAEADAQRHSLVFATRMTLLKLAASRDVAAALAAARTDTIVTICPELFETPHGWRIRIPPDAGYSAAEMPAPGLVPR